jgi:hypothetical protein
MDLRFAANAARRGGAAMKSMAPFALRKERAGMPLA